MFYNLESNLDYGMIVYDNKSLPYSEYSKCGYYKYPKVNVNQVLTYDYKNYINDTQYTYVSVPVNVLINDPQIGPFMITKHELFTPLIFNNKTVDSDGNIVHTDNKSNYDENTSKVSIYNKILSYNVYSKKISVHIIVGGISFSITGTSWERIMEQFTFNKVYTFKEIGNGTFYVPSLLFSYNIEVPRAYLSNTTQVIPSFRGFDQPNDFSYNFIFGRSPSDRNSKQQEVKDNLRYENNIITTSCVLYSQYVYSTYNVLVALRFKYDTKSEPGVFKYLYLSDYVTFDKISVTANFKGEVPDINTIEYYP